MNTSSIGLCNAKCCVKQEKFTKYHGWRDPDLVNKPRLRSIPNRMKRFMAELKGELTAEDGDGTIRRDTKASQFSKGSVTPSQSTYSKRSGSTKKPYSTVLVDIPGHKIAIEDCHKWARLRKSLARDNGTTVIRCVTCDYPYDSSKRRKPPHQYHPVVISMPQRGIVEGDQDEETSSAGVKNIPSSKVNKVHRVKRRRSSTELYKGLVSVD